MIKTGPVSLEKFSDRKEELQRLEKIKLDYLKGYRRNLGLIGPLSIGKTSLILKYLHQKMGEELFPIYLNLEEGFLKESFFGFLLFFLNKATGRPSEISIAGISDIGKTIEREHPFLASQVRVIDSGLKSGNSTLVLNTILKLPKQIKAELGKNCLFVLDEFFGFEKLKAGAWIQILSRHIMLDKDVLFILVSSDIERAKSTFDSELSFLFGNFEIMELKNFSYKESLEFLEERFKDIKYERSALDSLIYLTNGTPLYLDLLSRWIQENLVFLDWKGLALVLKENLLENKSFLYRYFQEKLNLSPAMKRPEEFLSFVTEIARGNTRKRELADKINLRLPIYSHSLNGFLEKSGSFYKISDPLFRLWLLYAYRPDLMGLKSTMEKKVDSLIQEIERSSRNLTSSQFENYSKEQLRDFISSLFANFQNEFIEVKGRKKLMPKFSRVEELLRRDEYLILKGRKSGRGIWLLVVFLSPLVEELAYKLLTDLKGKLSNFNQKIVISAWEIDESSRSILKAKGFWFWDLEFLNELIGFYGIPETFPSKS